MSKYLISWNFEFASATVAHKTKSVLKFHVIKNSQETVNGFLFQSFNMSIKLKTTNSCRTRYNMINLYD